MSRANLFINAKRAAVTSLRRRLCHVSSTIAFALIGAVLFSTPSIAEEIETGVVALRSIPDGAAIVVDGVPVSLATAEKGVELSAGEHIVDVVFADGRTVGYPLMIKAGKTERLRVNRKPTEAVEGALALPPFPIWPAIASSVATVIFGGAAIIYGVVFMRSLDAYETARAQALDDDGVGSAAPFSIVGRDLQTKSTALRADGITTAILAPAALAVGIATAGFWALYVVSQAPGEKE